MHWLHCLKPSSYTYSASLLWKKLENHTVVLCLQHHQKDEEKDSQEMLMWAKKNKNKGTTL